MGWLVGLFLLIIFMFLINSPGNNTGVVLYFANIGSGKTTYLSKLAIKELKKIKKGKSKYKYVVSNAIISGVIYVPDIRKLMKAGALKDTLLLIDEGSIEYNNRKQNLTELEITWFKLIRHYNCSTIVLSQSYDDIDITLRRLYTEIYILNRLPWVTLIRPIKKYVGIDEVSNQIVDKYKFKIPFTWRVFIRPIYFKYFNSWWIPDNIYIHDLEQYERQEEYSREKWKKSKKKVKSKKKGFKEKEIQELI